MRICVIACLALPLAIGCSLGTDFSAFSSGEDAATVDEKDASALPPDGGTMRDASDARDTGADADSGSSCPTGRGPVMVRITDAYGTFCIDATEVSNRHMNAFLASTERATAPFACNAKTSYGGSARPDDDKPATQVDWCDAWMFCAWAKKRLCGSRNGARIDTFNAANNPQISEWFAACSETGKRTYPYGSTYDANACAGAGAAIANVGTRATCEGGYPALFDMSGNVAEWEENCADTNECPTRGGDHGSADKALTCTASSVVVPLPVRTDKNDSTGIRCCAP